jgi:hypothetical protein
VLRTRSSSHLIAVVGSFLTILRTPSEIDVTYCVFHFLMCASQCWRLIRAAELWKKKPVERRKRKPSLRKWSCLWMCSGSSDFNLLSFWKSQRVFDSILIKFELHFSNIRHTERKKSFRNQTSNMTKQSCNNRTSVMWIISLYFSERFPKIVFQK